MRIELPSGTAAELVHPPSGPSDRGLVVIPDVMGMRPLFDDLVAHLAGDTGWSVAAFELYPGREHLEVVERLAAAATLDDDRVLGDAMAAADLTGGATVGILGFCMGGMYTLKAVGTGRFDRHCPFYGMVRVPEAWRGPGQGEPLDALAAGDAASVLAVIGCDDAWTPPADVDALEAAGASVARYEGADHGFVHDASRPAHRVDDAADAWSRVLNWLAP
ncbi:MAG: dienelactone hydrolase family protein [Actinomycetota bacterium]|nr:dienelactone hydrolase family protein [Actinomycetota bacterium]MEC9395426.1 dienelactone hydrolase family protein [Actinomycetota bacterium]